MSQKRFAIVNSTSMKGLDCGPIIRGGQNAAHQIQSNTMEKPRLKGFCLVSDTRGGLDYTVGMVVRFETGEILGANQGKDILDKKHFSFLNRGHLNAAGGYAEGRVLEYLKKGW